MSGFSYSLLATFTRFCLVALRLRDGVDTEMTCDPPLWPTENLTLSRSHLRYARLNTLNHTRASCRICECVFDGSVSSCRSTGATQGDPCFLMSSTPNQRWADLLIPLVLWEALLWLTISIVLWLFSLSLALSFLLSAAGAVCAERVHPDGAGSGGLGVQTLLPASAGSSWELAVHPAGAHRWAASPCFPPSQAGTLAVLRDSLSLVLNAL